MIRPQEIDEIMGEWGKEEPRCRRIVFIELVCEVGEEKGENFAFGIISGGELEGKVLIHPEELM